MFFAKTVAAIRSVSERRPRNAVRDHSDGDQCTNHDVDDLCIFEYAKFCRDQTVLWLDAVAPHAQTRRGWSTDLLRFDTVETSPNGMNATTGFALFYDTNGRGVDPASFFGTAHRTPTVSRGVGIRFWRHPLQ